MVDRLIPRFFSPIITTNELVDPRQSASTFPWAPQLSKKTEADTNPPANPERRVTERFPEFAGLITPAVESRRRKRIFKQDSAHGHDRLGYE